MIAKYFRHVFPLKPQKGSILETQGASVLVGPVESRVVCAKHPTSPRFRFPNKNPDPTVIHIYYHKQVAKMSFDKIFDLTAGVYFYFYNV